MSLSKVSTTKRQEESHTFKLVLFPDDKNERLSIDIAPSVWIFDSEPLQSKACRFPVGPFKKSQITSLHRKIKNCLPPDDSWPIHRVIIQGRARTYSEASEATAKLEYQRYAFSTDRESSVERAMREENEIFKSVGISDKTVEEELDEVRCVLTNGLASINQEKVPLKLRSDPENKKSFTEHSSSSSGASSPVNSNRKVQKKKEKKSSRNPKKLPTVLSPSGSINSSDQQLSSSTESLASEKSMPRRLKKQNEKSSASQKSFTISSPHGSEDFFSKLLNTSSGSSTTEHFIRKVHRNDDEKSAKSPTPQHSFSRSTSSFSGTPSRARNRGKAFIDSASQLLSRTDSPVQHSVIAPSSSSGVQKRPYSNVRSILSGDESDDEIVRQSKTPRQSRSREQKDRDTQQSPSSARNAEGIPKSHQRASQETRALNPSLTADSSNENTEKDKHRRSYSSDAYRSHKIDSKSNSGANRLAAVGDNKECVTLASLKALMIKLHNSTAARIDKLYAAQVESSGKLEDIRGHINENPTAQEHNDDLNDVDDANPIILPIETKEQFYIFDAKLKNHKEYRKRVKQRMRDMVPRPGNNFTTHHLSTIVRVFLETKIVTDDFVALKKTGTKDALKETNFYKYLLDVHRQVRGDEMDEKKFKDKLKGVFNSAGDWDGKRALRPRR